ncbi:hypothetical protein G9A89_001506 [Geosiphon pyriformis]|nr:hypothetical protein G9A89_001506 [Geosiphon pyriformis]
MKKVVKDSGSGEGFKSVLSRKKKKNVALEEGVGGKIVPFKVISNHSWNSETGDTTKSESINIEKECLMKETSFDYGESGTIANGDHDQMPKEPGIRTKKALGKLLKKINFSSHGNDNDIFLNNLVNVFVRKLFALNISLNKMAGNSSQEKLMVVKKLFSKIIKALFTSKLSLAQAFKKAEDAKILAVVVKKISIGTLAEAVCAVLSDYRIIKTIKIQLVRLWQKSVVEFEQSDYANLATVKWSILIRKDVVHVTKMDVDKESWESA